MQQRARNSVRPTFDCLEDRVTPAGNVQGAVSMGTLFLTGNNLPNVNNLAVGGNLTLTTAGFGTNTVNVGTAGAPNVSVGGTTTVLTGNGNDFVNLNGLQTSGATFLATQAGNDVVTADNTNF